MAGTKPKTSLGSFLKGLQVTAAELGQTLKPKKMGGGASGRARSAGNERLRTGYPGSQRVSQR